MNNNALKKYLIVGSVLVALFFVAVIAYNSRDNDKDEENKEKDTARTTQVDVVEDKKDSESNDSKMESDSNADQEGSDTSTTSSDNNSVGDEEVAVFESGYIDYDESKLANAENGRVVLFYHASWCPSCKGLEKDINDNKAQIPDDLLIMKVDFDSSQELKKKHQVVQQHTLVQVDQDGNKEASSQGLPPLNTLESIDQAFAS
ncbi:MAG: thioredoxin domain-containing protein [Patescibacteria group bacterium]